MVDEVRSRTMRAIKSKDTSTELAVRRLVHGMGFRFRLHRRDLPGSPDLVFPTRRKIIFVHGCFWHGHDCKRGNRVPSTNTDYWLSKIARNRQRDDSVLAQLRDLGWHSYVVWECQLKEPEQLRAALLRFLSA